MSLLSSESLLLNAATLGGLDRNSIGLNPMWLQGCLFTVFCALGILSVSAEDESDHPYSWWDEHKWDLINFVLSVLAAVCLVVGAFTGGAGLLGRAMLIGAKAAISGLVIGGAVGAFSALANGGSFWDGLVEGAVYGALQGFCIAVIAFSFDDIDILGAEADEIISKLLQLLTQRGEME